MDAERERQIVLETHEGWKRLSEFAAATGKTMLFQTLWDFDLDFGSMLEVIAHGTADAEIRKDESAQ